MAETNEATRELLAAAKEAGYWWVVIIDRRKVNGCFKVVTHYDIPAGIDIEELGFTTPIRYYERDTHRYDVYQIRETLTPGEYDLQEDE